VSYHNIFTWTVYELHSLTKRILIYLVLFLELNLTNDSSIVAEACRIKYKLKESNINKYIYIFIYLYIYLFIFQTRVFFAIERIVKYFLEDAKHPDSFVTVCTTTFQNQQIYPFTNECNTEIILFFIILICV